MEVSTGHCDCDCKSHWGKCAISLLQNYRIYAHPSSATTDMIKYQTDNFVSKVNMIRIQVWFKHGPVQYIIKTIAIACPYTKNMNVGFITLTHCQNKPKKYLSVSILCQLT